MSSDPHIPYARFHAALEAGQLGFIRAHAAQLAPIALPDALRICLLVRDQDPERYQRAVAVWIGRFALAARSAGPEDLRAALDAFEALPDDPQQAMEDLSELCVRHGMGG
jgi:hypothetical protein